MEKRKGTVVRFGPKGFGFITDSQTNQQWFVHVADTEGKIELRAGDWVEYEEHSDHSKGLRAINVKRLSAPAKQVQS